MNGDELNNEYFDWIYQLVLGKHRYARKLSYRKLMWHLHSVDFYSIVPMDENRGEDGIKLRYRFAYEHGYEKAFIKCYLDVRPCSVLEMMAALAIRCEEQFMTDPDLGDRTGYWFWNMIINLNLGPMIDGRYDVVYVDRVVEALLNRTYQPDGEGGLFTVKHRKNDLRSTEIWYQMCWYLDDIM